METPGAAVETDDEGAGGLDRPLPEGVNISLFEILAIFFQQDGPCIAI
jgi:hypothetical protein